ncbi:MAG: TolC family protein [Myxococcota bacterium]
MLLICPTLWAQSAFLALETDLGAPKINLLAAIDIALSKNEHLLQSAQDISAQIGLAKQARSKLLPTIEGSAYVSRDPTESMGSQLGLRVPLIDVSAMFNIKSASISVNAIKATYERRRDALVFDVALAYIDALLQQRLLKLAQEQHASSEIRFASAKRKAALGEISKLDLKRAELVCARTTAQIVKSKAGVKTSAGQLAYLLGENLQITLDDLPKLSEFDQQDRVILNDIAKTSREDLKAQSLAVQSALFAQRSALWMFMPTLDAKASLSKALEKDHQWQSRIDLTIPFYDGGFRYGLLQSARAYTLSQKYKKQLLEREILLEVEGALNEVQKQKELFEVELQLVAIGEASFKSAENRYALGQATSLDVLDEQTRLFEAQNNLEKVGVSLYAARLRLAYILGDPRKALANG